MRETITKLLGISQTSYYRWKEERAIISMLEKYFSEAELIEYLETGKIDKLEQQKIESSKMDTFFLNNAIHKIIESSRLPIYLEEKSKLKKVIQFINDPTSHLINSEKKTDKQNKNIFVNPLVHDDEQHALGITAVPLNTFLIIFNSSDVKNYSSLLHDIKNNNSISNFKRQILLDFCEYELSELEADALIGNKSMVNEYFENEKLKEIQRLNFDNIKLHKAEVSDNF